MIEKKLFDVINTQVAAAVNPSNLAGLFVHDHLFRKIEVETKPNGIRIGPALGDLVPGGGAASMVEVNCDVPVLIYVWVDSTQEGGDKRALAFQKAIAIVNELCLFLWNSGFDAAHLIVGDGLIPFERKDHVYDSNPYAVVSLSLRLSECPN